MKAKIKSINEVQYNGDVLVSLCGMRADLTDCIRIKPQRVANCLIPNNDGSFTTKPIRAGVELEFDSINVNRELVNPRFV